MSHRIESSQLRRPEAMAVPRRVSLSIALGLLAGFGISFALTRHKPLGLRLGIVAGSATGGALIGVALACRPKKDVSPIRISSIVQHDPSSPLRYENAFSINANEGEKGTNWVVNHVAMARSPVIERLFPAEVRGLGAYPIMVMTRDALHPLSERQLEQAIGYCQALYLPKDRELLWEALRAAHVLQIPDMKRRVEIELARQPLSAADLEAAVQNEAVLLEREIRARAILNAEGPEIGEKRRGQAGPDEDSTHSTRQFGSVWVSSRWSRKTQTDWADDHVGPAPVPCRSLGDELCRRLS
jgi:hypothetical protein